MKKLLNERTPLETLQLDLQAVSPASASEMFTSLFTRGCDALGLNDAQLAVVFDTSRPNVSRWRRGIAIPPASNLVLLFLLEEVSRFITERDQGES